MGANSSSHPAPETRPPAPEPITPVSEPSTPAPEPAHDSPQSQPKALVNVDHEERGWFFTVGGKKYGFYPSADDAADVHDAIQLKIFVNTQLNFGRGVTMKQAQACIHTCFDVAIRPDGSADRYRPPPRRPLALDDCIGVCRAPDGTYTAVSHNGKRIKCDPGHATVYDAAVEQDRTALRMFMEDAHRLNFPVDSEESDVVIDWPPADDEQTACNSVFSGIQDETDERTVTAAASDDELKGSPDSAQRHGRHDADGASD